MTDQIPDITIIGGGPTGLFASFYAGMRGATAQIVDALPELGGQLTALYPEKYIFDVGGFTRILAKDLVKALREQGTTPPGADDPSVYAVRSGGVVLPRGVNWVEATSELRKAFVEHPGLTREVLGGIPAV